jgi:NADPH-dependent ferric siderophore reductase
MIQEPTPSRVQRVRHELRRRTLHVVAIDTLSPHVRAITFGGEALDGFVSAAFDDHVKLILAAETDAPVMRDYTPRAYDAQARRLTIEFALHGDGPAARWAAAAQVGDSAVIGGPRGSFVVPMDYDWHLLVGDSSALPAMARRLQELPPGARVWVVADVPPADRRELPSAAQVTLHWADGAPACEAAVRALALPPGEGYAWCAGEARTAASLRQILVEEKGHSRHAIRASAYWKRGAQAHHEDLG